MLKIKYIYSIYLLPQVSVLSYDYGFFNETGSPALAVITVISVEIGAVTICEMTHTLQPSFFFNKGFNCNVQFDDLDLVLDF